jgi:hypothetical protein
MDEAEQAATASAIVTSPAAPASALFLGLCPGLDACGPCLLHEIREVNKA